MNSVVPQLGPIDALISVFGPFALPVLLFFVGLCGYLALLKLNQWWVARS
ncbi:hypothetical protein [Natronocalculus amylovorans]|uniref:Uncharacterized protein n=1 Tax=Natronocalculus amylovorans TaxID=2917812 RepID=A0AAE3FY72_9EURY|nr:hypothetical protein [Natronocalculus amylovorans]MCL9817055.1 hypothetical protein [Natronocalculus amylovorans]NUE02916.1 hypothetical protein [Halorubraceae archaeon YAN]